MSRVAPSKPSPNAEPDLLAWHEAIAQRPAVGLGRFYWDQKTTRLWFASLVIDEVTVDILTRKSSGRGWPGFIIAADFDSYLDPAQGLRIGIKTPRDRKRSVSYKPAVTTGGRPPTPSRWLTLTTGVVGVELLDEAVHLVKVVRAGTFTYVKHEDIHAARADHVLQDTRRQWADAWLMIAPRLDG